ncbi:MAG TPA: peptidase inhibitor family I36 protein [Pseudonocardiaceae bacterium]|nr:peptidase inhibitor family I36 protein [Pseudonocardiaceae bacterium]
MVAGAGMAMAFAAPAQATTSPRVVTMAASSPMPAVLPAAPAGCTAGNLCFWKNKGFNDGPGKLAGTNSDWRVFSHATCAGGVWNDCASSLFNADTVDAEVVFKDIDFGGDSRCLPLGASFTDLSTVAYTTGGRSNMNDSISSNRLTPAC